MSSVLKKADKLNLSLSLFVNDTIRFAWYLDRSWNSLPELSSAMHDGKENMAARRSTWTKLHRLRR